MDTPIKSPRLGAHVTKNAKNIEAIRNQVVGFDTKVPTLGGQQVAYVNFDNAASTPVLKPVLETLNDFMPWYSSVHRGTGYKSIVATEAYEDARRVVGEFFGANSRDHIVIFGKNSTEALNKLSYRLPLGKDDIVLVSLMEHHSNDLPWRRQATIKRIKIDDQGRLDEKHFEQLLAKYAGRVKLVAVTGASNVTGYINDTQGLARKAHAAGAQILVDCAQLAPHRQVDILPLSDPAHLDYIVVSAHKFYAPFGTGALIGRRDTFEVGEPELCGGGTIDLVTTKRVEWTSLPDRDEAGSPNVVGAVTMAAALKELDRIGMDKVAAHESELTAYALDKLNKLSNITIYGDSDSENNQNRLGVIPFKINGQAHGLTAAILGTEWGIGVRSGCFCAHPYVNELMGVTASEIDSYGEAVLQGDKSKMPGMVRVSFGIYNNRSEIDRLIEALQSIVGGKISGNYTQDIHTGEFRVEGWNPSKPSFI